MGPPKQFQHNFLPYILIALVVSALFFLLLLDRRTPIFSTPEGMFPFLFIAFAIALVLGLFALRAPIPHPNTYDRFWLKWHRSGPVGGALTGLIFLAIYWAYDWPAPNRTEISERQVNQICHIDPPVTNDQIIWSTPNPFDLIPEFMLVGLLLGTVVAVTFPRWHGRINLWAEHRPSFSALRHPYPSGLLFGLTFGALIGAWLCPLIFSVSDGRPFIRVSTSATAVFLAVALYLLFEMASYRYQMSKAAYATLASVLSIGVLLASLVWFLDVQLNISTTAYCFFYDAWNTQTNELNGGWLAAIAGAIYGAMIGAITMSIATGYMIIRTTIQQAIDK